MYFVFWCVGTFWYTLLLLHSEMCCPCVGVETQTDLYEKAEYHLTELSKTLKEIEPFHRVQKRDTENIRKINILNSLADICSQLNTEQQNTTAVPTTTTEKLVISYEGKDKPNNWKKHQLFLVDVKAELVESQVCLTFKVSHTAQAFVARLRSIEYKKILIGNSGSYGKLVVSEVTLNLTVPSGLCQRKYYYHDPQLVDFLLGFEDNKQHKVSTSVNTCSLFGLLSDISNSTNQLDESTKVIENALVQHILPPQYRFVDRPVDSMMMIMPGESLQFDMDIYLPHGCDLTMAANLFNWDTEKYLYDHMEARVPSTQSEAIDYEILHAMELNSTSGTTTIDSDKLRDREISSNSNSDLLLRVRITIPSKSLNDSVISGELTFTYTSFDYISVTENNNMVLRSLFTRKTIILQLPYKLTHFPRNQMFYMGLGGEKCDKQPEDPIKNCFVECYAEGEGIKSIFIIKAGTYKPPLRFVSYVLFNEACAINDVGPPTTDNEGPYTCVVVFTNGTSKTKSAPYFTTGFVRIHSTSVDDLGNGTHRVSCSASGMQPILISVISHSGSYTTTRVDNIPENSPELVTTGNKTEVIFYVKTKTLQKSNGLEFIVRGLRNRKSKYVNLKEYFKQ